MHPSYRPEEDSTDHLPNSRRRLDRPNSRCSKILGTRWADNFGRNIHLGIDVEDFYGRRRKRATWALISPSNGAFERLRTPLLLVEEFPVRTSPSGYARAAVVLVLGHVESTQVI